MKMEPVAMVPIHKAKKNGDAYFYYVLLFSSSKNPKFWGLLIPFLISSLLNSATISYCVSAGLASSFLFFVFILFILMIIRI